MITNTSFMYATLAIANIILDKIMSSSVLSQRRALTNYTPNDLHPKAPYLLDFRLVHGQ
jgi:hypothetical protein